MKHILSRPLRMAAGLVLLGGTATWGQEPAPSQSPDEQQIVHVLNRITFGPRPGDVEMVRQMGLRNYIEQQLHPETILVAVS